jgi:hypothetical protein
MKILAIEIIDSSAGMLIIDGSKETYKVNNLGKLLNVPKSSDEVKDIIEFQTNFSLNLQNIDVDLIVLCEGGNDSSKKRIRMEFSVLSECEKLNIPYQTYASSASTKLIKTGFERATGVNILAELEKFNLPKYMGKAFVAGWRYLK